MAAEPYMRAIAAFEGLVLSPQDSRIDSPAALIRAADLPSSSGYRHLTTLEGAGLLARDKTGAYTIGPTALRIGLSALGIGQLAVLAPPILLRLRETTGRTTFLAQVSESHVRLCVFSVGREARTAPLPRTCQLPARSILRKDKVSDVYLADPSGPSDRLTRVMLCPVPDNAHVFIGLIPGPTDSEDSPMRAQLTRAASFFKGES